MPVDIYTAHQKSELGLPLTSADLSELLKDPNSWVAKLYQECIQQAAITVYLLIHYIISAMLAEQRATIEATAREKIHIRAEERKQQSERFKADSKPEANISDDLRDLKTGLDALLKERQAEKNLVQLASYHQKLVSNLNQQLVAKLGPLIELKSGLTFNMPPVVAPVVAVNQVLAVNPVLAQQVSATPDMQEAFALFHAKATMGHLTVLKMVQAIIDHSGKDESTITVADKRELTQYVDKQIMSIDSANPELFKQLFLNGALSLKLDQLNKLKPQVKDINAAAPSLAKNSTIFSTRPAQTKVIDKDQGSENKPKLK